MATAGGAASSRSMMYSVSRGLAVLAAKIRRKSITTGAGSVKVMVGSVAPAAGGRTVMSFTWNCGTRSWM